MTAREKKIIEAFRKANDEDRQNLKHLVVQLSSNTDNEKQSD